VARREIRFGVPGVSHVMTEVHTRGLRVLTANEDREALDELTAILGRLGHAVMSRAVSVPEAVEMIASEDPDVSLVRLHHDDDHALNLIAELSESASGPVIAVLDEPDPDFVSRAAEGGIAAFVQPVDEANVQAALELAVRRHADSEALSEKVDQLETALQRRTLIERAKGILMERHGIGNREAFELLREHARNTNQRVVDVAQSVDDGYLLLPKDPA
jgi:AmiR/NasT family two-component response regulator